MSDGPALEKPFYKLGCSQWLSAQSSCSKSSQASYSSEGANSLEFNPSCRNGTVKLGIVGHWQSTEASLIYVSKTVIPAMKKYNVNLEIDNTA